MLWLCAPGARKDKPTFSDTLGLHCLLSSVHGMVLHAALSRTNTASLQPACSKNVRELLSPLLRWLLYL